MRLVSTAAQVRKMDRAVIEGLGVPGIALMESASRAVADAIRAHHAPEAARGVLVVCGAGNNGGDGYAVARWLHGWGFEVALWPLKSELDGDAAINRDACARLGIRTVDRIGPAGLLVDAVFGTGLSRPVEGRYADALSAMADHPAPVVAVDLPSGLHADSGAILGVAVPCARTVTFGRLKPGLLAEPGAGYAGVVEVADIGIEVGGGDAVAEVPGPEDLAPLWPERDPADHKKRSGHLLVVAGSRQMAGAAVLACRGALAAGVGLLTVVACRGMLPRLAALPPEAMVVVSGDGDRVEPVPASVVQERTALAAGPGLGGGEPVSSAMGDWLQHLWETSRMPMVFDADALPHAQGGSPAPRVITPHPGEAGRLLGMSPAEVQADRFSSASRLARDGVVALLKGRNTLVAAEGTRTSVNTANSTVLATGGSGDVLTGLVGALLARGASARDAARLAAWVHGRAAQRLEARRAQGWTAGDVADEVPAAVEELTKAV